MGIIVLGLNHKSAPLDVREQVAFDARETKTALRQLKAMEPDAEFVLLSTCNRVELYCAGEPMSGQTAVRLIQFLSDFHNIEATRFAPFSYCYENEDAVRHLLLVSASLDSMVVGEAQILGQVKDSYRLACAAKSTGKTLNRLFHSAFFTAKKVHTVTSISSGRVSVAGVAVELAMQLFADISRARVLVIGAGETGELVVQHLLKAGCTDITVVNRSYERGANLGGRYNVALGRWEELSKHIDQANIVISSVATQEYLYSRDTFEKSVHRRKTQALLIIDVGVPRNFEPTINKIENVYLYGLDELKGVAEQSLKARKEDIAKGLDLVYEGAASFMQWFRARDIGPLIGRMKDEFKQIGQNELRRFLVGPRQGAPCRELMEAMVNRVVNKLLHCVITNVNTVAKEAGPDEAAKLIDAILKQAREISCESAEEAEA